MSMKKFFLMPEDRDDIIQCLLQSVERLEDELKAHQPKDAIIRDVAEAAIQRRRHLAALFKVEEHER